MFLAQSVPKVDRLPVSTVVTVITWSAAEVPGTEPALDHMFATDRPTTTVPGAEGRYFAIAPHARGWRLDVLSPYCILRIL